MDPSVSRTGPRFVSASKNNFLNIVYQKEEQRASREFNGWSSLSRAGTSEGHRLTKTATRLGFGETSVKLHRSRPRSASKTYKPPLDLLFTVKPQQSGLHVPKRFNLGPAISLSSSSQVSLLLRSGVHAGAEYAASPNKKTLANGAVQRSTQSTHAHA